VADPQNLVGDLGRVELLSAAGSKKQKGFFLLFPSGEWRVM